MHCCLFLLPGTLGSALIPAPLLFMGAKGIRQQCLPLCKLGGYQMVHISLCRFVCALLCEISHSSKWEISAGKEGTIQMHCVVYKESVFIFLGPNQLIFHPKWCHVCLGLICHLWVLDPPHLKAVVGPIYWLSANRIALLHWTLDLRLSSNVALSHFTNSCQYIFENQVQSD
jgi:hypothetical protein